MNLLFIPVAFSLFLLWGDTPGAASSEITEDTIAIASDTIQSDSTICPVITHEAGSSSILTRDYTVRFGLGWGMVLASSGEVIFRRLDDTISNSDTLDTLSVDNIEHNRGSSNLPEPDE